MKKIVSTMMFIGMILVCANAGMAQWKVQSAVAWGNGNAYFFNGSQYSRYNINSATIESTSEISGNFASRYPKWDRIDAATSIGSTVYLFRDKQYVRYNTNNGEIDGSPQAIEGNFTTNFPSNWNYIDAAVNLGNGIIYLFHGTTYVRYNISQGKIDGAPQEIEKNFAKTWVKWNKVDAALNMGNGYVYFFNGDEYFRYKINGATISSPQKVIGNFSKSGNL